MKKKIYITGASGVGKTTIAKYISSTYNIPFVSTSAKHVWDKFGFIDHHMAHSIAATNKITGIMYQEAILDYRVESIKDMDSFVTDRSPVDNAAYILLEISHHLDTNETQRLLQKCDDAMKLGDGIIYLGWDEQIWYDKILARDSRINNMYYQGMVDWLIYHILDQNRMGKLLPVLQICTYNFDERIKEINEWLLQ